MTDPGAAPPPAALEVPRSPPTSPTRLVATLTLAGVAAGILLAAAYHSTLPAIERTRAQRERAAVAEVLGAVDRVETLYAVGGRLVEDPPAGVPQSTLEKVFRGVDAAGKTVAFALTGSSAGYADLVVVLFAWDPATRRVTGMKVLENRETPGLGDKVQKDPSFAERFRGRETPLVPVRPGKGTGDAHEVDTISGATISSKTVVRAINQALARWEPLLATWAGPGGGTR